MKVVLPVHHFLPRYSAGVEIYVARLARWLADHGHQAEVVCVERLDADSLDGIAATRDSYEGITVWRLALDTRRCADPFGWSYDHPLIGAWFGRYLAAARPDVVHLHGGYLITPSVLAAAKSHTIATALTLHDYWFLCPRTTLLRGDGSRCAGPPADPASCAWCMRLDSRRYRIPDRLSGGLAGQLVRTLGMQNERQKIDARRRSLLGALGQTDAVVAPSRFLFELVRPHVLAERLHLLELGLDPALFQVGRAVDSGRLRIVYLGQIAPHKGVHVLVEALRRLPVAGLPVELHIYGGLDAFPGYVAALRRAAGTDERIGFHGRFANQAIGAILAEADLLAAPSLWHEIGPLTVKEAFAAGVPAIVSTLGNMADLVRDEVDGLHVAPGDVAHLTRQLQRLRDDPALLQRLRRGVRPPPTLDTEMQQLLAIYERAIRTCSEVAIEQPAASPQVQ